MATTKTAGKRDWKRFWLAVAQLASICVMFAAMYLAVSMVGRMFGWLVGASESPITAVAAPLVFGLLGATGIAAGAGSDWRNLWTVGRAVVVCLGVWVFCCYYWSGLSHGVKMRVHPYESMQTILGTTWQKADPETIGMLYQFRWHALEAGVHSTEFNNFIHDAVQPILDSDASDKTYQLKKALESAEYIPFHQTDKHSP